MRREFLQLADTYNPAKHKIAGYLVSEKLDGTRCFWDGGLSRGVPDRSSALGEHHGPENGTAKIKSETYGHGSVVSLRQSDHGPGRFPECPASVSA